MARTLVLLVDDNLEIRKIVSEGLKRYGFMAVEATSVAQARDALTQFPHIRLVVSDSYLKDGSGRQLYEQIEPTLRGRQGTFVLLTGGPTAEDEAYFIGRGITVLRKPVSILSELVPALRSFVEE